MKLAENPKLEMAACELEEKMGTQKISVSDHVNGFQYTTEKSDNFVIDMESFPHGANKEITANSRISLQKSLSKKGSLRGIEKKINSNGNTNDREMISSPRGCSTPEKAAVVAVGTTDHASNPQVHHQITITTGNINNGAQSRFAIRKNSFIKRSHPSWVLDPKKVLLFFATLSSVGSILLIIFTLTTSTINADDIALD